MILTVSAIAGLPGIPSTNRGVRDWLKRRQIPLAEVGNRFTFEAAFLPPEARRAVVERQIEASGLALGSYDDEAHCRFAELPASMRAAAERKAEIARLLLTRERRCPGRRRLPW